MRTRGIMLAAGLVAALAWSGRGAAADAKQGQLSDDLKDSLQKLHATNQAEIGLARTAASQAKSPRVKQFAQRLAQDHTRSDRQLEQEAQRLGVQLQGGKYQDALENRNKDAKAIHDKKGEQFDRDFVSKMVDAHKDALKDVHDAATKAADQGRPQLAELLGRTEATLLHHQAMAEELQGTLPRQAGNQSGQAATGTGSAGQPSAEERGEVQNEQGAAGLAPAAPGRVDADRKAQQKREEQQRH